MTNEPGARPDLERRLARLWKQHGYPIERVEVGEVPLRDQGSILCANFLPEASSLDVSGAGDEMVRLLFVFLITKRQSRHYIGLQSAVNVKAPSSDAAQLGVCRKYWIDQEKLRGLENVRRKTLETMSIDALTSGRLEIPSHSVTGRIGATDNALPLPE